MQVELQPNIVDYTGPSAIGRATSQNYWERHQALINLMRRNRLWAVNTWAPRGQLVQTRIPFGKTQGDGSQLDYLFVSQRMEGRASVSSSRIFRSDHLAVAGEFKREALGGAARSPKQNLKGWKPVDESQRKYSELGRWSGLYLRVLGPAMLREV